MSGCDECRRGLLRLGLAGAASLVLPACSGGTGQPLGGDEAGSPDAGPEEASAPGDDAGTGEGGCGTTCTADSTTLTLPFTQYPKLQSVGGSAVVKVSGWTDPVCGQNLVIVAQVSAGEFVAVSASCTHACCTVGYTASISEFTCPCHGSAFATSGKVVRGPARTALPSFSVCADDCAVYVTLA